MKNLCSLSLIFLIAIGFNACCFPRPISQAQAEKIGFVAVEHYCQLNHLNPSDFKLGSAQSEAIFINFNKNTLWSVNYISYKPDGSPDIEVVALIDRCGDYQMSTWNYSKNSREIFL